MADNQEARSEADRNFAAFQTRLPGLLDTHAGKFAVMHDGEIVDFFDTLSDAVRCGRTRYGDTRNFSIQEVVSSPVTLGYYSYAMHRDSFQRSGTTA